MNEHPIEGLMRTAMNSIKDMVDVNTIIGEPIETSNDMVIIPISKVCFGFAAGGSEFSGETINEYKKKDKEEEVQYRLPFGGGSGAGVSINPVAFVIVNKDSIKVMPIEHSSAIDKLMDYVPDLMQRANNIVNKTLEVKKIENNVEKKGNDNDNELQSKEKKDRSSKIKQFNKEKENERQILRKNMMKGKNKNKKTKIEEYEIVYDEESDNPEIEEDYDIEEYLEDE